MTRLLGRPRGFMGIEPIRQANWGVLLIVSVLVSIGIATLYSVEGGSFQPWAERHGLRFLVGTAVILAMLAVPLEVWLRLANPLYVVALLLVLLVPFVGVEALGARRWLSVAGLSFQPTELMKVVLVLALARYYQWLPPDRVSDVKWVLLPLLMIAVPVVLTLRQPDLGSATLFAAVGLALMFFAGVSLLYFIGGALALGLAAPLIWSSLYDYQRRRVEIFLDPDADPLGAGYHINQSKIALGAGGVSGKGYMQGTQSQLDFLPEKHTDFIFTMFGEEWGFAGNMLLLSLYAVLLFLLGRMAARAECPFTRLLIAGSWVTIFLYVFINVAMVTGLVPVVGVPLPFVSYGGTSMMTLMAGLGLALAADARGSRDRLRWGEVGPLF
jgi:rod shape determining protein RodA